MLSLTDSPVRLCDGISRREWLRVGGLGAFGLSLPGLRTAQAADRLPALTRPGSPSQANASASLGGASFGKAKSCIVLFLLGGPPQHETWDPKPDAPAELRGDFKPIASAVPGLSVGELMPKTAKLADRVAVLRAMSTDDNAHTSSGYWMLTGYPHSPKNAENGTIGFPNNWPCVAAVVKHLVGDRGSLPASVRLPEEIWNTGHIVWPGQDAGWLGHTADPWYLYCDPNAANFRVSDLAIPKEIPPLRLDRRRELLEVVNQHLDGVDRARSAAYANSSASSARWGNLDHKAFDLLRSPKARAAFDLNNEPAAMRDRYGRNRFGQSVLLARRLVEAGVSLVQVNWARWETDNASSPAWDNHQKNSERLKTVLMPPMDLAYSALLEDLEQRGMLEETLVVWMGEFGRTPRINASGGRDHWGHVYSAALAGGGVRGGAVHGVSDRQGGYPVSGRVEPQDLTATIFHCLGFEPHTELRDSLGRPMPISRGEPIAKIFGVMSASPAIDVSHVSFHYGERRALDDLSLSVNAGEIFAFLGPNGGGKTTLFRLLSTLIPPQSGEIGVLGQSVRDDALAVRRLIGVVFQAPSVDKKKLTVAENIRHQGWLYGLAGTELKRRQQELLQQLGLADRTGDRVETLSGGLRRRVEIAKSMLHRPRVLLMDEPSTGLDPAARIDLWHYLRQTCDAQGMTVALTTHLLEEAEKADRLAILDHGRLVALDTPGHLRAGVGGDTITIVADDVAALAASIGQRFDVTPQVIEGNVRLQHAEAQRLLGQLVEAFGSQIRSITLGKPTLEDVFIERTGHRFWSDGESNEERQAGNRMDH